jgi:predicted oxidoreductase (fatty acid repression mutant protein)
MRKELFEGIKKRRSYYGISKEKVVSEDIINEIIKDAVKYTPSAFNSQTARVVLLIDKQHDRLWDITMEALRNIVPAEDFGSTEDKINSFKSGYGTVLFYEDQDVIESLQKNFEIYKDNFPVWSLQSSGMLQLVIWTALENEGLGASLQHYGELIDEAVKKEWTIPSNWKLLAQMPFGKQAMQPAEKQFNISEEHIKVYK